MREGRVVRGKVEEVVVVIVRAIEAAGVVVKVVVGCEAVSPAAPEDWGTRSRLGSVWKSIYHEEQIRRYRR